MIPQSTRRVSKRIYGIVKHHGLFQGFHYNHHYDGDRNARDIHKDHGWYHDTVRFCADYDQVSFDPDYPTEPSEFFEAMVRRVLAKPT
jgi:predicted HD phosphohydrolase